MTDEKPEFFLRAMYSCDYDWLFARATGELEANALYEYLADRYDYVELWQKGVLIAQNYVGESDGVWPDYVTEKP